MRPLSKESGTFTETRKSFKNYEHKNFWKKLYNLCRPGLYYESTDTSSIKIGLVV